MQTPIELRIDVTDAAALGVAAFTAASVFLPEGELARPPIICFAFPGGGYSRGYFSFDMPDTSGGGEAGYHAERGWIFVACDPLGVGDSTIPAEDHLDYENISRANRATVEEVMRKLESGTLREGYPAIMGASILGIGQSMGGCFIIVQQALFGTFDGVGILGFSGIHTVPPPRPGAPPLPLLPWITRCSSLDTPQILNKDALAAAAAPKPDARSPSFDAENPFAWCFHYDDEPAAIVELDMGVRAGKNVPLPSWRSATMPRCWRYLAAPGTVAMEAASILVPVLIAVGERDMVPDPWTEPKAFKSSTDISVFVCSRMGHMHNFAHTRFEFWQRIHSWGTGVAAMKRLRHPRKGGSV